MGISAVALGKLLDNLGLRRSGATGKVATDVAISEGCAIRRWDGYALGYDWNIDRVLAIVRRDAGADVETAPRRKARQEDLAFQKRQETERVAAAQNAHEQEVQRLRQETITLLATDPGMSLLDAIEYVTAAEDMRLELYRGTHSWYRGRRLHGMSTQVPEHLTVIEAIDAQLARGLQLLERRAASEGYHD